MIELLDPEKIDPVAYKKGRLKEICRFSLLPGKRIGWNYCMDYTWLSSRYEKYIKKRMKVVDIGCGPGAIHGYLEKKHGVKIIGIDMNRWEKDYVDYVGDYSDAAFRCKCGIENGSIDLIISTSAFEHNTLEEHMALVNACLSTLKKGGRLITTFSASPGRVRYSKNENRGDLSKEAIEKIYNDKFEEFDYKSVWKRWRKHRDIPRAFKKRYGWYKWTSFSPPFLSVGADVGKK